MDNAIKFFLVFGIIVMSLFLYVSIVPCKTKNNNNQIENFELPVQLTDIFQQRSRLLNEQVVESNILGSDISVATAEVKHLKNKLQIMLDEMKNNGSTTYMINTNGEVTKEVE